MIKQYLITLFLLFYTMSFAQQNCNIYKWDNNMPCYEACELYSKGSGGQGSRSSQIKYDKVMELCPTYDDAYWAKAIPYLKRGDFISWGTMIDKAVELNPTKHLGYRGWCKYQFLRDYDSAIADLEKLESMVNYDIGYCQNGDYHLTVAKALCYKGKGNSEKAIQIIEKHLENTDIFVGLFDYLHLGVLYLEKKEYKKVIELLQFQIERNEELAENYYYLALAHKGLKDYPAYKENISKALKLYQNNAGRSDPYTEPMDKIYLETIIKENEQMKLI